MYPSNIVSLQLAEIRYLQCIRKKGIQGNLNINMNKADWGFIS